MAVGIRIRDTAGNVSLDTGDRITRLLGSVSTGAVNGRIDDSRVGQGRVWFHALNAGIFDSSSRTPRIQVDANGLSWTYQLSSGQTARDVKIIYGLF